MALACPKCGAKLSVFSNVSGKAFPCRSCHSLIKVDDDGAYALLILFIFFPYPLDFLLLFIYYLLKNKQPTVLPADEAIPVEKLNALSTTASLEEIMQQAEEGDASAQFQLGTEYENGERITKDSDQSFVWYLKSAKQANADAQCAVGKAYFTGSGVERNFEEAYYWYSLAAKAGKPQKWADAVCRYLSDAQIDAVDKKLNLVEVKEY